VHASLEQPATHRVFAGDLTKQERLHQLIDAAEAFGPIDVILHVMGGGMGLREPLLTWDDLTLLFHVNLAAAAEINRRLIPPMIARQSGNIVHVGSIASTEAVGSVGYNTVKAALAAYVRSLGRTLASTGVIVTGVLPGGFWAPDNAMARLQQRDPQLLERWIVEREPRKRLGQPEEIIPLMGFLASRKATMMSGCCVPIDAGEGLTYAV
jgi:3-oxoacyl-[acyl-carrier protein] reductase